MSHIKYKLFIFAFVAIGLTAVTMPNVSAVACPDGFDGGSINQIENSGSCDDHRTGGPEADSVEANQTADPTGGANLEADCNEDTNGNGTVLDSKDCGIVGYIVTITNVLSAVVGIVIVIMIAVGGIQYSMARDDPQAVNAAKTRIRNAILALVFYLFMFAFLQYLVPGGLF